jgi:hypothetical protein
MTARQSRTERRAAERKARKIARKAGAEIQSAAFQLVPAEPHSKEHNGSAPSATRPLSPELQDEFSPEFLAYARSVREHVSGTRPIDPLNQRRRAHPPAPKPQHSTGPRTSEGKLASSRNSLKHGLASAQLIIPGEDPNAFDALLTALLDEHQPANPTQEILVQQMAQSYWLTQRAIRFQNQCFTPEDLDEKRLALFLRYQTTHERAFHKALNTLIRLKKQRPVGFVSQQQPRSAKTPGFVSQSEPVLQQTPGFVSQSEQNNPAHLATGSVMNT